jgi:predicted restriction endonuclease
MGFGDVTAEAVRRAAAEYDRLGADAFRETYGFGPARRLVLVIDGRTYDSKAIIGVAHGYSTGEFWRAKDFTGGIASVVRTLERLGFETLDLGGVPQPRENARYGDVPECPEGATFASRAEAHAAGVHRQLQAGICGTKAFGAESIVVSGGYIDDEDLGDLIIYTGHGKQDTRGRQIADQTFEDIGNAALLTSSFTGAPVRVVRGAHKGSSHAPGSGYRYDGLFRVVDAWQERGRDGFRICRYKLVKVNSSTVDALDQPGEVVAPDGTVAPERREATVQRIVRSTEVSRFVKELYGNTCQACGTRLELPGGRSYSEGAHIKPLGRGHAGPDIPSNVLCLCPNCHVLFDSGALIIDADMKVRVNGEVTGQLTADDRHAIGAEFLLYHRDRYELNRPNDSM